MNSSISVICNQSKAVSRTGLSENVSVSATEENYHVFPIAAAI
jgi:hypothetical protein